MEQKVLVVSFLVSLGGISLPATAIKTPNQNGFLDDLVSATVNVLTSCYGNHVKAVGISGELTGLLLGTQLSKTLPVISIDNMTKASHNQIATLDFWEKLEIFTIVGISSTQLHNILQEIKNTPWWNHMASFLILNWSAESNNDCSSAYEFLRIAWEMDLLNAKYLCVDSTNKVFLYSYNPYTEKAPYPWKLRNTYKGNDAHPWSLFVRGYREDEEICEGLDFDKTEDLGGYAIRCSVKDVDTFWHTDLNKTGVASFGGIDGISARMWFRAMNAEAKLLVHIINEPVIFLNEHDEVTGLVIDLANGSSDVILNTYYYDELKSCTVTYPHLDGGLGILTQFTRPLSQLSKLNSVIDITSRYSLYSMMLITPMLFKFFSRRALIPAILDTIRIICNSCLPKLPNNTGARIFLATLFSFQITILALYQGQLASLLTKSAYGRNVDTMQDLAVHGHTIYAHKSYAYLFTDPIFKNRFVGLEIFDCLEYVLRDATAACVRDSEILRASGPNSKLHVSTDMVIKMSSVVTIRDNWPLEHRFNRIIARTVENGVLQRLYAESSEKYTRINGYIEKSQSQSSFRVITLNQLNFAFAILVIGLGLAFIIFIFEIVIG